MSDAGKGACLWSQLFSAFACVTRSMLLAVISSHSAGFDGYFRFPPRIGRKHCNRHKTKTWEIKGFGGFLSDVISELEVTNLALRQTESRYCLNSAMATIDSTTMLLSRDVGLALACTCWDDTYAVFTGKESKSISLSVSPPL